MASCVASLARLVPSAPSPAPSHELPLVDAGEGLLEGRAPWYREWVSRRDPADPYWSPMVLDEALERVQVPVLLQTGWQDLFLEQTLEQYARLSARGLDVALTVGPWTHVQLVTKGGHIMVTEALDWFAEHLGGSGIRTRAAPVKVFVTGAEQWRDLADLAAARIGAIAPPPAGRRTRRRAGAQRQRRDVHLRPLRPDPVDRWPTARSESWRLCG